MGLSACHYDREAAFKTDEMIFCAFIYRDASHDE
jgi:hypothetical protein